MNKYTIKINIVINAIIFYFLVAAPLLLIRDFLLFEYNGVRSLSLLQIGIIATIAAAVLYGIVIGVLVLQCSSKVKQHLKVYLLVVLSLCFIVNLLIVAIPIPHLNAYAVVLTVVIFIYILIYYITQHSNYLDLYLQQNGKQYFKVTIVCHLLLIALFTAFLISMQLLQFFYVQSDSMQPALQSGDIVLARNMSNNIKRGDIVIIRTPGQNQKVIKRVVALPGDQLRIEKRSVYVNNKLLHEPYAVYTGRKSMQQLRLKIPDGTCYVLGDNRMNSIDSRSYGVVLQTAITAVARAVIYPGDLKLSRIGSLK